METIYLDHNASTGILSGTYAYLESLPFLKASSASLHAFGRQATHYVETVKEFILNMFSLAGTHQVIFHSGATEGISNHLFGLGAGQWQQIQYSKRDHPLIKEWFKNAATCLELDTPNDVLNSSVCDARVFKYYTLAASVTGEVFLPPEKYDGPDIPFFLLVDATQLPSKFPLSPLPSYVDAYVFSGHKFGSLKGIGFSIVKKNSHHWHLSKGVCAPGSIRPGTLNLTGIASLYFALTQLPQAPQIHAMSQLKNHYLQKFSHISGVVPFISASETLCNTLFMGVKGVRPDWLVSRLDMKGLAVSNTTACKSLATQKTRVVEILGLDPDLDAPLRISFSPYDPLDMIESSLDYAYRMLAGELSTLLKIKA